MAVKLTLLIAGAIVGVIAIVVGGVLGFMVLPDASWKKLKNNVRLELSETYRIWENPPFNVTTKMYFYIVKNAEDIQRGDNPLVEESGPIIYKQTRRKDKIVYDSKSDTFTYDEWVSHEYDPSSSLKETDIITTLNVLKYMSLAYVEEADLMEQVKNSFGHVFNPTANQDLFHKIKIKDFLITGYKTLLLEDTSDDLGAKVLRNLIVKKLSGNPRFKKSDNSSGYNFFVFRPEQNYQENTYEMYGGVKDISKQGQLKSVNGEQTIHVWPKLENSDYCNSIRGTDSYTFNPDFDTDEDLAVYSNDMCRSLDYAFTEEVEVKELTGQRLILKSENFAYPTKKNTNQCFCIEEESKCINDGFLNLFNCFAGIPLIASQPHFLYTGPANAKRFGFSPSVEKDVSYIDIQAESGATLRASRKTQYNIWLREVPGFTDNITSFMMPLFWVEESMEIPDHSVEILNDVYFDDLVMIEGVKWGLLVVGVVLLLGCVGAFVFSKLNIRKKALLP